MQQKEDEVDELILLIRDSFIPAFTVLKDTLVKKLDEAENDWAQNTEKSKTFKIKAYICAMHSIQKLQWYKSPFC